MKIFDTHAHLCDSSFDEDLEEVLNRAVGAGVCKIVAVSEDLSDARRNLQLSEIYSMIRPAAGLYPDNPDQTQAQEMVAWIRKNRARLWAIGEVGLDFWIAKAPEDRELQANIFSMFVDLSLELDLPLNVHSRSTGRHVIDILLARGARRVQLHAFDGKFGTALAAVEAGFFFSIPPSVARSRQKQKLVRNLPLSCMMVESDSPVLGPEAGERNEPANSRIAIETIAYLKGETVQIVAEEVYNNSCRLYGKDIG
ncbi:MAG: TatD family hydrolase [Deltaproteobacteria bacterium]|nr:TatD family hydrolase [Deltaproteobacteria bacterium]